MANSTFERYGGFANVSKVVMAFYDKLLDSDQVGHYFDGVDLPKLIDHQTKFIATVMGGPASYSNEALHKLHAHLNIGSADFKEMAELLRETLEDFAFEAEDIERIVGEVAARAPYIIND